MISIPGFYNCGRIVKVHKLPYADKDGKEAYHNQTLINMSVS